MKVTKVKKNYNFSSLKIQTLLISSEAQKNILTKKDFMVQ